MKNSTKPIRRIMDTKLRMKRFSKAGKIGKRKPGISPAIWDIQERLTQGCPHHFDSIEIERGEHNHI